MLGSDPVAALLGAGVDPLSPPVVWKSYLRKLVDAGAAVAMLCPDVVVPKDAGPQQLAALSALAQALPSGERMPYETTGRLAEAGRVDATSDRINLRVGAYFRRITKLMGKQVAPGLLESGAVTPGAGVHVGSSKMLAVLVPDAAALQQWREWSAQVSGDHHERHSAPTVLFPRQPGGGAYLFRGADALAGREDVQVAGCRIALGDTIVPVPPTRQAGAQVMRLGPCRMAPPWLLDSLSSAPLAQAG